MINEYLKDMLVEEICSDPKGYRTVDLSQLYRKIRTGRRLPLAGEDDEVSDFVLAPALLELLAEKRIKCFSWEGYCWFAGPDSQEESCEPFGLFRSLQ